MINRIDIKWILIISMLCAGLIPLVGVSVYIITGSRDALHEQSFKQLESLRGVKKAQIEDYFEQIASQVETMSESRMTIEAVQAFRKGFHNLPNERSSVSTKEKLNVVENYYQHSFAKEFQSQTHETISIRELIPESEAAIAAQYLYIGSNEFPLGRKSELNSASDGSAYSKDHAVYHPIFRNYLEKFSYYDIFLVDPETGHIVYSVFKELDYGTSLFNDAYRNTNFARVFREALNQDTGLKTHTVDFEPYIPSYKAAASFMSAPIYEGSELVGVLVFQMPVGRINEIMQFNEGLGESGETYLLGSDGLMRSQSRFVEDNTILAQEVESDAAKAAVAGDTGSQIVPDYRGINVLSAYVRRQNLLDS